MMSRQGMGILSIDVSFFYFSKKYFQVLILAVLFALTAGGDGFCSGFPVDDGLPFQPVDSEEGRGCRLYTDLKGFKGFSVREFNRVDGFAPSFALTIGGTYAETDPQLDATVIYYTEREKFGWELDFHKSFQKWGYLTTGFVYRRITDTYDRWRMGDVESSLASFLLKESFRNYFEREGISIYFTTEFADNFLLKSSYTREDNRSLDAEDPFTIPGDAKEFGENLSIDDGELGSLSLSLTYDSRDNIRLPHSGWYHEASLEVARDWTGGDFSFTRWFINLRRYHPVHFGHFVNLRFAFAGSAGDIPAQRVLTAGGVGTLRGYRDVSLAGDYMVLANAEYRFPMGLSRLKPALILFNEINGMVFFDTGEAWFRDQQEESKLLSDVGIGLSGANLMSYFGLYIAWPISDSNGGTRVTIKIQRDF